MLVRAVEMEQRTGLKIELLIRFVRVNRKRITHVNSMKIGFEMSSSLSLEILEQSNEKNVVALIETKMSIGLTQQ